LFNKLIHNETVTACSFIPLDSLETARNSQQIFAKNPGAMLMLNAVKVPVFVSNHHGQIIAANEWFLELCQKKSLAEIFGKQPELVCPEHLLPNNTSCQTSHTHQCTMGNELFSIITIINIPLQQATPVLVHDLKNGLNAIVGLTSTILNAAWFSPDEAEHFSTIFEVTSDKLRRQISFFHAIQQSSAESFQVPLKETNIVPLLDQLCTLYTITGHRQQIKLYTPRENIVIQTDQTLLEQVFENLLKNACEASPRGATIQATISETAATVQIAVHNPAYIQPEIQSRIFTHDRVSTKDSERGFGTRSIKLFTEKHLCGHVAFISTPEDGTTFTITLPKSTQNLRT
jgi:signal transduction histidine kinase